MAAKTDMELLHEAEPILKKFEDWFASKSGTPLISMERAIIKTFLVWFRREETPECNPPPSVQTTAAPRNQG